MTVEQSYTDNIRSQSGPRRDSENFTTWKPSVGYTQDRFRAFPERLSLMVLGHVFYRFPDFNYVEVRPRAEYGFRRTDVRLEYQYTPRRLLFDREEDGAPGAYFTGNLFDGRVQHKFGRHKRLRSKLGIELDWRDFESPDRGRTEMTPTVYGDLRFVTTSRLTPRVGFEYGQRAAKRSNYDREEIRAKAGFDLRLLWGLTARFRYERIWYEYTVDNERGPDGHRNSNYGRDDDINQYEAWLFYPVPILEGLVTRFRYKYRDADSTRPDRVFTRTEVSLEFSYAFRSFLRGF